MQVVLITIKVIEKFVVSGAKVPYLYEFNINNFVEYFGRSLIFYFIYPFYNMMSNKKSRYKFNCVLNTINNSFYKRK